MVWPAPLFPGPGELTMTKLNWLGASLAATLLISIGCSSTHEKDVKSNMRTQWVDVAANTENTTAAAKDVLQAESLKNVQATATAMDGTASGMMADNTKVHVDVKKKSDNISSVSVVVGTMGDPKVGAGNRKEDQDQS